MRNFIYRYFFTAPSYRFEFLTVYCSFALDYICFKSEYCATLCASFSFSNFYFAIFPFSRTNNGMLIVCHHERYVIILHRGIFLCIVLLLTFYLCPCASQVVTYRHKRTIRLCFIYHMESELIITDSFQLASRCLRENVYYVKNQRIYHNANHCLHLSTDGFMSTSKRVALLSLIVIYFCAHLVYGTFTN